MALKRRKFLTEYDIEKKLKIIDKLEKKYSKFKIDWGYNGLGYFVYKRTYARAVLGENRTEELHETVARTLRACIKKDVPLTDTDIKNYFKIRMDLKGLLSGRKDWQLGAKLSKLGFNDAFYNCWFYTLDDWKNFLQIFDQLMLGGGCGFSIESKYISQLPVVKKNVKITHCNKPRKELKKELKLNHVEIKSSKGDLNIVGDSREGWIQLASDIFESFFVTGKSFKYNTSYIRDKGTLISGFGGIASGDEELIKGMTAIINILKNAEGRQLTTVEAMDIVCLIASIVVSGNVRRSALLCLGDMDDEEFLVSKRWDLGTYKSIRQYVNISVNCNDIDKLHPLFWESYEKEAEQIGLVNIENCQKYGRTGYYKNRDRKKYYNNEDADPNVKGVNPCGEQTLDSGEGCLLASSNIWKFDNYKEFMTWNKIAYKILKHITQGKFLYKDTQDIINANSRIGISFTGLMNNPKRLDWLSKAYKELREFDYKYSEDMDLPICRKITTNKPEGTLSLLAGSSSAFYPFLGSTGYQMRTVRVASNNDLWKLCEKNGYKVEDKLDLVKKVDENGKDVLDKNGFVVYDRVPDKNTKVIYFPIYAGDNTVLSKDMNVEAQMDMCLEMQEKWSDSSVSSTVTYQGKEELPLIKKWLKKNWHNMKTISFLVEQHGFLQAPLNPISKEEYDEAISKITPITSMEGFKDEEQEIVDVLECKGGFCSTR